MAVNWEKGLSAIWNGISTGDYSQPTQAYYDRQDMKNGNISSPVGNQFRGLSSLGINATAIAKEDWLRQEQSAILSFDRQSQFNAEQAPLETLAELLAVISAPPFENAKIGFRPAFFKSSTAR